MKREPVKCFLSQFCFFVLDGEPTALFEDVFLAGFQPVIDVEQPSMKIPVDLKVNVLAIYFDMKSILYLPFLVDHFHLLLLCTTKTLVNYFQFTG